MDFDLTEEQSLLQDSVTKLLAATYSFEQRKSMRAAPKGYNAEMWRQYADLGLLALPFAEADGGLGGGPVEVMLLMEAFGRSLVLEPYFATVVLAGGCLRHGANESQRSRWLPALIAGDTTYALAHGEREARFDLSCVKTRATRNGADWVLDGEKSLVLHGNSADRLVVSARVENVHELDDEPDAPGVVDNRPRLGGGPDGDGRPHPDGEPEVERRPGKPSGIALFVVDAASAGIERRGYTTQDGLGAADIKFRDVRVGDDARLSAMDGLENVLRVIDEAIAASCAEAVGTMERAHEITVDYLKQRKQFGVAIGSFQALQHRAVDMLVMVEQARSMAYFATMMVSEADAALRSAAMSAAKIQMGRSARYVGEQAVQLHGGIGVTEEHSIGHYYRRLTLLEILFGDTHHHLAKLAQAGGLGSD